MFPSIDAKDVGASGLIWLFLSYGYILFMASNLISEGSDLLLLIPSLAGLVGGVVLPLLGAVPDGAIMLFSGLGEKEQAQETLAVGVGALAGSTIMLLTVPWFLSVFAGRVDLVPGEGGLNDLRPNYHQHPKLTKGRSIMDELNHTGVALPEEVRTGAVMMMLTTIPYFLIQIPASFLSAEPTEEVAEDEKWWACAGFVICIIGFVSYMYIHVQKSRTGADRIQRIAVMKRLLGKGKVSLSGALADAVISGELAQGHPTTVATESQALVRTPPPKVQSYLNELLREPFQKYDQDNNGTLERDEIRVLLRDFSESISEEEVDELFAAYDGDGDGTISFDEFVVACYSFIAKNVHSEHSDEPAAENGAGGGKRKTHVSASLSNAILSTNEEEEEEDVPEDLASLSPEQQQAIVKRRAFIMLTAGTALVAIFSDPMVEVVQEISNRIGIPSFYVSFMLAPLAANASEVIASQFYAAKKTRKTITVSFTALEGAASMNNTFCLSIFMGLIFIRGLAWQYTAETIAIVVVQFIVAFLARKEVMTTRTGLMILFIFPLSVAFVAILEAFGFD